MLPKQSHCELSQGVPIERTAATMSAYMTTRHIHRDIGRDFDDRFFTLWYSELFYRNTVVALIRFLTLL